MSLRWNGFCWFGQIKGVLIMEMISVHNSRFCAQPHSKERAFTSCAVALENPQTYTSSFHQITFYNLFNRGCLACWKKVEDYQNLCYSSKHWITARIHKSLNYFFPYLTWWSVLASTSCQTERRFCALQSLNHYDCDDFLCNPAIFTIRIILSSLPLINRSQIKSDLIYTIQARNNHFQLHLWIFIP